MTRDTDARLRSDASARELGCTTAIAAMIYGVRDRFKSILSQAREVK